MLRTWTALKSVRLSLFMERMANTCIRPMRLRGRLERLLLICFVRWLRACRAFTSRRWRKQTERLSLLQSDCDRLITHSEVVGAQPRVAVLQVLARCG